MNTFTYRVVGRGTSTRVVVDGLHAVEMAPADAAGTAVLVVEAAVAAHHLRALEGFASRAGRRLTATLVVAGGEEQKDIRNIEALWDAFDARGLDRDSVVVAVGGGALLDAVGFAAATWLRGVGVINIPTTLVAQVDAALGGKSAINAHGAKNRIGVTRQPALIVADPAFLATLSEEAFAAGLGEMAKTALLAGGAPHDGLLDTAAALRRRDPGALADAIGGCLAYKAQLVTADPDDENGTRIALNAGHTFGHVYETTMRAQGRPWPHGLAVAAGLWAETRLHPRGDAAAVLRVLDALGLPHAPPAPSSLEAATAALARDKKSRGGVVAVPVITGVGVCEVVHVRCDALAAVCAGI